MTPERLDWRQPLERFISGIPFRQCINGVLVCGSYITGDPNDHSDLDTHIILNKAETWRERGNRRVDGVLIEYFANPPSQIETYFQEDLRSGRTASLIQFATGEILSDNGDVKPLKERAKALLAKGVEPAGEAEAALLKYGLWDAHDNLRSAVEENQRDAQFQMSHVIGETFRTYCRLTGYPIQGSHQIYEVLTDERVRAKYLLEPFPDAEFADRLLSAIASSGTVTLEPINWLVDHVLSAGTPFSIESFQLKSGVSGDA